MRLPPASPRRRPPWRTSIVVVLAPAEPPLVAAIALLVAWLGSTAPGLRALLWAGTWAVPTLQATSVQGSLHAGFTLERLAVDEPGFALVATDVVVNPAQLGLQSRIIDLAQLSAATAIVAWAPRDAKSPIEAPASLALPLSLRLSLVLAPGGSLTVGHYLRGDAHRDLQLPVVAARRGAYDVPQCAL